MSDEIEQQQQHSQKSTPLTRRRFLQRAGEAAMAVGAAIVSQPLLKTAEALAMTDAALDNAELRSITEHLANNFSDPLFTHSGRMIENLIALGRRPNGLPSYINTPPFEVNISQGTISRGDILNHWNNNPQRQFLVNLIGQPESTRYKELSSIEIGGSLAWNSRVRENSFLQSINLMQIWMEQMIRASMGGSEFYNNFSQALNIRELDGTLAISAQRQEMMGASVFTDLAEVPNSGLTAPIKTLPIFLLTSTLMTMRERGQLSPTQEGLEVFRRAESIFNQDPSLKPVIDNFLRDWRAKVAVDQNALAPSGIYQMIRQNPNLLDACDRLYQEVIQPNRPPTPVSGAVIAGNLFLERNI